MTTFFLSYARADAPIALKFADDLIAGGLSLWVDQYDIRPSQHWDRAVETAVRGCGGFIVILSPRSVASANVADEVSVAVDDGKTIIPILIEKCTPPLRITRMQYIDATLDHDAALARCLAAAGKAAGAPAMGPAPSIGLPAGVLAEAERRLTGFIGPIAPHLVRQAAKRATTIEALYEDLATSLYDPVERRAFLSWLGPPAPAAEPARAPVSTPDLGLSEDETARLVRALTRGLGPIAAQLVKRERALASSPEDLRQRLAARIPSEKDRAAFLAEIGVR